MVKGAKNYGKYVFVIALIALFFFLGISFGRSAFDPNLPNHFMQQITKSSSDLNSIDSFSVGAIKRADLADFIGAKNYTQIKNEVGNELKSSCRLIFSMNNSITWNTSNSYSVYAIDVPEECIDYICTIYAFNNNNNVADVSVLSQSEGILNANTSFWFTYSKSGVNGDSTQGLILDLPGTDKSLRDDVGNEQLKNKWTIRGKPNDGAKIYACGH